VVQDSFCWFLENSRILHGPIIAYPVILIKYVHNFFYIIRGARKLLNGVDVCVLSFDDAFLKIESN